ncbi:MAG: hypothetical protein US69_C0010G0014 [candidate division TM6 bacterium GW2011_GWF2_38_10]|nr:MAG: hypothetical protein US69_C0010G0014 [candidate division TM6 bacterium GW2011_GWF2_38_10]
MVDNQKKPHYLFINCKNYTFSTEKDNNITEIYCRELRNNQIDQLIALFPHLQNLTISTSDEINDQNLTELLNKISLNKLTLHNCPFIRFTFLDPESLKNITHLCINRCHNVKDAGLKIIPYLENLYQLDVIDCDKINGSGLHGINNLHFLTKISIQWCKNISHDFFKALEGCESLLELEITGAPTINNDDFRILNTLAQLETLTLRNCKNLTNDILPQLSTLSLYVEQCQNINLKEYNNQNIFTK